MAPSQLHLQGSLATSDYIEGPLIVAFSVISLAEVFRGLRFLLLPLGAWLIFAPWVLGSYSPILNYAHLVAGVILIIFSWRKGKINERYGAWERLIF